MDMYKLIKNKDMEEITQLLMNNPSLANEGIPFDDEHPTLAHPLHRICDAVHAGSITDEQAVEMAKVFLMHGADVHGGVKEDGKDSPLVAAASLYADQVGILLVNNGADIHHAGCHGGTALHWAGWCGRPVLLERLIEEGASINRLCRDFVSTPLFWTIHGYRSGERKNATGYLACVKMLLDAGADKSIPNVEGYTVYDMLEAEDVAFREILD